MPHIIWIVTDAPQNLALYRDQATVLRYETIDPTRLQEPHTIVLIPPHDRALVLVWNDTLRAQGYLGHIVILEGGVSALEPWLRYLAQNS